MQAITQISERNQRLKRSLSQVYHEIQEKMPDRVGHLYLSEVLDPLIHQIESYCTRVHRTCQELSELDREISSFESLF